MLDNNFDNNEELEIVNITEDESKAEEEVKEEKTSMRMYALYADGRKARRAKCSSCPTISPCAQTVCTRQWTRSASLIIREC